MDQFTRRRFLIASGVAGGAALAAGGGWVTWDALRNQATLHPLAAATPILVVVTLYGGNDGINTVIPYADPAYHAARPDFAYAPTEVLHLDDQLGLNPEMTGLAALWRKGQLAIVRGAGYPNPDHSHFRSMDIWQTASPAEPIDTGWIGRWLDATGDDPLRAVNIGSVLPPLAVGAHNTAAALITGRDAPFPSQVDSAITGLGTASPNDTPPMISVATSCCSERTVSKVFAGVLDPSGREAGKAGSAGGSDDLAGQLDTVARCIDAGVPTRVYSVSLGGFDTHADEKDTQQRQLGTFDKAVSGFLDQISTTPHGNDVVVLAYSEFGRRVHANASNGTDHGTAGPVFVAGPTVRGGFYSEQPSLTDLDDGDLKSTVDFRSVYAELSARVLGTDPARVLGADFPQLGFLS